MGLRSHLAGLGPSSHRPLGGRQPLRPPPPARPLHSLALVHLGLCPQPRRHCPCGTPPCPHPGFQAPAGLFPLAQHGSWSGWSLDCATLCGDGASRRSGQPDGHPDSPDDTGTWGLGNPRAPLEVVQGLWECHMPPPFALGDNGLPATLCHHAPGATPGPHGALARLEVSEGQSRGRRPPASQTFPAPVLERLSKKSHGLYLAVPDMLFLLTVLVPWGEVAGACSGSGWDGCPRWALHHCSAIFATVLRV